RMTAAHPHGMCGCRLVTPTDVRSSLPSDLPDDGIRHSGRRPDSISGNGPDRAFMKATRSCLSCSDASNFLIFSDNHGLGCPPFAYHSTTSSSVFWLPSCM